MYVTIKICISTLDNLMAVYLGGGIICAVLHYVVFLYDKPTKANEPIALSVSM